MRLDKAAKEVLKLLASSLPGSGIILAAIDDDIDKMLSAALPKRRVDEMKETASEIAEAIAISTSPFLDRNPGAARSAAYDFLHSLQKAELTFDKLLDCEFEHEQVLSFLFEFRSSDWDMESPQRKQLWSRAASTYIQRLLDFYLSNPRFNGYILAANLRRLNRIAEQDAAVKNQ
ncbi:MAG: hypothetical protein QNK61_01160 [Akkermansiaceae bacterium]